MVLDFVQRPEIDLDQHRNDHDPNQEADRQVDFGDLHLADCLKHAGKHLPCADADHNADEYPYREVSLKDAHRRGGCLFVV